MQSVPPTGPSDLGFPGDAPSARRWQGRDGLSDDRRQIRPLSGRASESPPPSATDHGTVLVIDDEKDVCALSGEVLRRRGFRVLTAQAGRSAVELFSRQAQEIDLVLLDMTMPDMTGRAIAEALRRHSSDVPIVVTSGNDLATMRTEFADLQPHGYLEKAFSPRELHQIVVQSLADRRKRPAS